jgi:hypothetical protein
MSPVVRIGDKVALISGSGQVLRALGSVREESMRYIRCVVGAVMLSACSVEAGVTAKDEGSSALPVTTVSPATQILAEVRTSPDELVQFIEAEPGMVTIAAIGRGDPRDSPLSAIEPTTLVETYEMLGGAPDAAVIEVLRAAEARGEALRTKIASQPELGPRTEAEALPENETADDDVAATRQALIQNTVGTFPFVSDTDFRAFYCNGGEIGASGQYCAINASGSTSTGFSGDLSWIRSLVAPRALASATHWHQHWICTLGAFGACLQGRWTTQSTQNIPSGGYGIYIDNFKWTKFLAQGHNFTINHAAVWFF